MTATKGLLAVYVCGFAIFDLKLAGIYIYIYILQAV